ncbi:MAG: hypothetical protein KME60_03175 [Cyanomargarita calcarea GSE-NOS-MK-12-04C]|jgi:hypothetical protein|uniref:Uncharacterized protein n=1 Tax=Cyanomargarita calcarea GSE-NOS-MK-12-04C TaxID=2839659 RepID=A0A951QK47_9CYAN|nr:hypothetical protein [Cyanomargarita calcarea GSE-NOS-MK-12-04C]
MPAKRKRTQANIDGNRRYQQTVKRVIVTFKRDSELLDWLRSQVTTDAEIPALIKQIIEAHRKA